MTRARRKVTTVAVVAAAISCSGCGAPPPEPAPDTAWGRATTVEELAIGVEYGADEYMFAPIRSIAVADDGTIYVADGQPIVRAFDAEGTFLHDIGGEGQGPGEYEYGPALRVLRDGRLAAWDYGNSRISFFSPEGEFLDSIPTSSGFGGHTTFYVDRADNLYVRIMKPGARSEGDQALAKYSLDGERLGEVDLPMRDPEGRTFYLSAEGSIGAFHIETSTAWSRWGYVVTGRNDVYDIELRDPEGTVHLRRDVARAEVNAEEQAEWEAFRQSIIDRQIARGTDPQFQPDPVPDVKPYFRDIFVGQDGRVWVWRFVEAAKRDDVEPLPDRPDRSLLTWREPWTFDVFEPDGTFLGSVVVPELFEPFVFRGDQIWGSLLDEEGVERVIRLRVVPEAR